MYNFKLYLNKHAQIPIRQIINKQIDVIYKLYTKLYTIIKKYKNGKTIKSLLYR